MINHFKADMIEKSFSFHYTYLDFFYPFCEAKGYEDIEGDENVTDEMYDTLETEFFEKFPKAELEKFRQKVWKFIEEGIEEMMTTVAQKNEINLGGK